MKHWPHVSRMEHIRQFFQAVGGKWFLLPSATSGIIAIYTIVAVQFGGPALSWWAIAPIALGILIIWAIAGLMRTTVKQQRRIREFHKAWDRSGRELIPIKEAIEIVSNNLADQWPPDLNTDQKRVRAAAKLRGIGRENQIPIWGIEVSDLATLTYQDHAVQIPPWFWNKNRISLEFVDECESTPEQPIIQTIEDERNGSQKEEQPIFPDLRINRFALEVACPPRRV